MSVTVVACTSPPAPSPPAASVNGRPAGGVVPWRGAKVPAGGGPPPPGEMVIGDVASGVVPAAELAGTPGGCPPTLYRARGPMKGEGGSNAISSGRAADRGVARPGGPPGGA